MPLPDLTKPAEEFGNLIAEGLYARATYYAWAARLVAAGRELTDDEAAYRLRALTEIHAIDLQVARKGLELTEAAAVLLTYEGGSEELSKVLGLSGEPDPSDDVLVEVGPR